MAKLKRCYFFVICPWEDAFYSETGDVVEFIFEAKLFATEEVAREFATSFDERFRRQSKIYKIFATPRMIPDWKKTFEAPKIC